MGEKTTVVIRVMGLSGKPGSFEVEGEAVGKGVWAATRTVGGKTLEDLKYLSTWEVTHVPTGLSAFRPISSKRVALALAEKFVELGMDSATSEDPSKAANKVIEILGADFSSFMGEVDRRISAGKDVRQFIEWLAEWKPSKRSARAAKKAPTHERPAAKRRPAKPEAPAVKAKPKAPAAKVKAAKPAAARPRGDTSPVDLLKLAREARSGRSRNPQSLTDAQDNAKHRCLLQP